MQIFNPYLQTPVLLKVFTEANLALEIMILFRRTHSGNSTSLALELKFAAFLPVTVAGTNMYERYCTQGTN